MPENDQPTITISEPMFCFLALELHRPYSAEACAKGAKLIVEEVLDIATVFNWLRQHQSHAEALGVTVRIHAIAADPEQRGRGLCFINGGYTASAKTGQPNEVQHASPVDA